MRYLPVLVLACLPLAVLTGWSLWQAVAIGPAAPVDEGPLNTAEVAKRASEEVAETKKDQSLVRELAAADLLDPHAPELDSADAKLKEAWGGSQDARRVWSHYARLGTTSTSADAPPAVRRREAEASLAKLRDFIDKEKPNYVGRVPGADELFDSLARRMVELEREIEVYRQKDRVAEALAAVKSDLEQGRYDACLKRLAAAPLDHVADRDLADTLFALRSRAEYRRAWEELDRDTRTAAERDLFHKIETFLRRYPDPPSKAEADLQARIERRRDRLKHEIAVHDLDQIQDLDTLLVEAAEIIASDQIEQPIKQHARRQATEWIQHRLPKIEPPPSLLGKQEAVTKSGQRKIGIFFLPPGVDNYRFWTDRKNRDKLRQGEEQISSNALEQPPATPRYVAWAENYNQEMAGVVRRAAAMDDWQQFADDCDTWQRQLAAYREQWGIDDEPDRSCREWSFRDAGQVARNVLRHWEKYQSIVAPSQ